MVSCTLTCPTAGDVQVAVDRHEDQLHHGRQDGRIDGKTGSGAGRRYPHAGHADARDQGDGGTD